MDNHLTSPYSDAMDDRDPVPYERECGNCGNDYSSIWADEDCDECPTCHPKCESCGKEYHNTTAWVNEDDECDDCAQNRAESMQERMLASYYGGDGPQTDAERDEVSRRQS